MLPSAPPPRRVSAAVTLASPPPSNRKSTKAASAGISINPHHRWCCPTFYHGAGPSAASRRLPAGAAGRESDLGLAGGIDLVFDLDQRVEHHRPAAEPS